MTHSDVLVVGSQSTASSGDYTRILMDYQADPSVALRAELLDRILGQAAVLEQQHYAKAVICLSALELEANLALLLGALSPSLASHATLHIPHASRYVDLIKQAGFEIYSDSAELTSARKTPSAPAQTKAVPLKLRPRNGARKASLWATQPAPSTPSIDESTLLTEADLQRRETIQEPDCDVKRTRKACKNCSCGLRELLLQEQDDLPNANKATQINAQGQAQEDKQVISTGGATSSCGSCYLGDAFRCASCPYLGLPAFEPGQKVSLGSFGDDI